MSELPFQLPADTDWPGLYIQDADPTGWATGQGTAALSVQSLRTYLDVQTAPKGPMLSATLLSAVRIAERFTRRALLRTTGTKRIQLLTRYAPQYVRVPDLVEADTVALDGATLIEPQYSLEGWPSETDPAVHLRLNIFPAELSVKDEPDTPNILTVSGTWGYDPASMPADLADAIYVLAARRYKERDAGYADSVDFTQAGGVENYFRQLPANVKLTFCHYKPESDLIGMG